MSSFHRYRFLRRFGYLKRHDCRADLLCPHVSLALRRFQAFYRLEETGTLTLETLKLMSKPRCGLPDLEPEEIGGPGIEDSDPFVFGGTPWGQQQIRWFMGTGSPDLNAEVGASRRGSTHGLASFQGAFPNRDELHRAAPGQLCHRRPR